MQSKKRFTETNIWEAAWFMGLDSKQKLFWYYLNDRCDNIGVWEPNFKLLAFQLEIPGDVNQFAESFLDSINHSVQRIKILDTGAWLITEFVRFQYCKRNSLNPKNPAHNSYIQLMRQRNLWEYFCQEQPGVMPLDEIEWYEETNIKPSIS